MGPDQITAARRTVPNQFLQGDVLKLLLQAEGGVTGEQLVRRFLSLVVETAETLVQEGYAVRETLGGSRVAYRAVHFEPAERSAAGGRPSARQSPPGQTHRTVHILRNSGLSLSQIAQSCQISKAAVVQHLHRPLPDVEVQPVFRRAAP